jgi:hypothetical protein
VSETNGVKGVGTEGSFHLTDADKDMSVSHLKDTLEYNLRHAEEHLHEAKKACARLIDVGVAFDVPRSLVDLLDYFEKSHTKELADAHMKSIVDQVRK